MGCYALRSIRNKNWKRERKFFAFSITMYTSAHKFFMQTHFTTKTLHSATGDLGEREREKEWK
ncbi:hypothetical protein BFO01nite_04020 [Brevibacillus formosus]|uniref:Uncharacterized protein n=1 Tax=Brevibacillus formosus TaxID=54913 RepID=A0ABQ0SZ96_9BACL|nr:hypothetical protein BFO01nite_04020 [Brevibacillus formosus]